MQRYTRSFKFYAYLFTAILVEDIDLLFHLLTEEVEVEVNINCEITESRHELTAANFHA